MQSGTSGTISRHVKTASLPHLHQWHDMPATWCLRTTPCQINNIHTRGMIHALVDDICLFGVGFVPGDSFGLFGYAAGWDASTVIFSELGRSCIWDIDASGQTVRRQFLTSKVPYSADNANHHDFVDCYCMKCISLERWLPTTFEDGCLFYLRLVPAIFYAIVRKRHQKTSLGSHSFKSSSRIYFTGSVIG